MRRRLRSACILLALALAGAAAPVRPEEEGRPERAPQQERPAHPDDLRYAPLRFHPPAPAAHRLQNGLRVWTLEDRSLPVVEGLLVFEAGSIDDPAKGLGLAELVGELLRSSGTQTRPAQELDAEIDRAGARVSVSVGEELTVLSFFALSRDLDWMLQLLSDLVRNPAFRQDRLELARSQMEEEIRRRWDDPGDIAELRLADLAYGPNSRWARRPSAETLGWIGQDTCRAFHSRYLVPNRAFIGIAGDVAAGEARRKIEALFGHWRSRPSPVRGHEKPGAGGASAPGIYWIERDLAQAQVALGHLGARRHAPEHPALRVMNLILGGGYSSRLYRKVRTEHGLTYGVSGGVGEGYDRGLFRVDLATEPGKVAQALRVVREVLSGARSAPPDDQEIRQAREREANSFVFHFDSPAGVVEERVVRAALGYPADYLDKYLDRITSITPQTVQRVARSHIRPESLVVLIVGPEAAVAPLREAGTEIRKIPLDPDSPDTH